MYTPSSSFVGYVAPDPAWQGVLDAHAAVGGSKAILASYARWGNQYNLNTNLAIAQACLEAAYFTSERWVKQWNPCGLGVTSSTVPGPSWGSLDDGIRAHLEHLCCYVYTLAQCPVDHAHTVDPRHAFHDGVPQFQTLERPPTRQWAVPGTTYIADILAIVNGVVTDPGPPPPVTEPQPWTRLYSAADVGPDRALSDVQWFVVHDTEGSFPGDEAVLTSAAPPVESVHFLVGRNVGECDYMVPITATAWTAGNDQLSEAAVQVELSKAPDESGYTDWQYDRLAAIYRWCVQQGMTNVPPVYIGPHPPDADNGPLPDVPGIIGHEGVPDGSGGWGGASHHTDPGPDFDWPRFIGLIGQPAPPPDDYLHLNGHLIGGGFKAYYLAIPEAIRLQDIGLPTSDEQTEQVTDPAADGVDAHGVTRDRTVQHFERGILIYQPEEAPPWQVVRAMETQIISQTTMTQKGA